MSSSIWTRCAGDSELRPLRLSPWRVVESQHQVSTRKLVDSADEQALLEELIDGAKPPDLTRGRLHYLLFTPFRYPPLAPRLALRPPARARHLVRLARAARPPSPRWRTTGCSSSRERAPSLGIVTTPLTAFRATLRTDARRGARPAAVRRIPQRDRLTGELRRVPAARRRDAFEQAWRRSAFHRRAMPKVA